MGLPTRAMLPTAPHIIARATHLSHCWNHRSLFDQLEWAIPAGVTLVRGQEQTGKTTLLRILAGELTPTTGWVEIQGVKPDHPSHAYAKTVFRADPLAPALDPISPAQWYATLPQSYPSFNTPLLNELVDAFGLTPHIGKPVHMLSAGSRRKTTLIAAIASGAALTLLDQPFAALDSPSTRLLNQLLQDFSQSSRRACVIADYEAPENISLACTLDL